MMLFNSAARLICMLAAMILFGNFLSAQDQGNDSASQTQDPQTSETDEWQQFTPTGARAAFKLPIKPRYVERRFSPIQDKPPIKVHLHIATINDGTCTFVFGYHDLNDAPKNEKNIEATLDGAVRGSVANVFGQLIGKPTRIRFKQAMGRQFVYQYQQIQGTKDNEEISKPYVVTARVFIHGNRQYQINCLMEQKVFDEQLAGKFLNSFEILDGTPVKKQEATKK